MNKNAFTALLLCFLVTSCAPQVKMQLVQCETVDLPDECIEPRIPKTLTVNTNSLNIKPEKICVKPGETLTFKLVPPPNNFKGNAAIVAKNPSNTWLSGNNSDDKDEIKIPVPDWVPYGQYDYGLALSDGRCIDPRVRVEN